MVELRRRTVTLKAAPKGQCSAKVVEKLEIADISGHVMNFRLSFFVVSGLLVS